MQICQFLSHNLKFISNRSVVTVIDAVNRWYLISTFIPFKSYFPSATLHFFSHLRIPMFIPPFHPLFPLPGSSLPPLIPCSPNLFPPLKLYMKIQGEKCHDYPYIGATRLFMPYIEIHT